MSGLATFLRITAPVFVLVGALHLCLGLNADALLGAKLPADVIADATLDSQNRFYGTSFTLYGALLWLSASDLARYATVLRCLLVVFLASGVARLVSIALRGNPSALVLGLMVTELVMPAVLLVWLARSTRGEPPKPSLRADERRAMKGD
jgi:Domain of unknown function (DUF4345)